MKKYNSEGNNKTIADYYHLLEMITKAIGEIAKLFLAFQSWGMSDEQIKITYTNIVKILFETCDKYVDEYKIKDVLEKCKTEESIALQIKNI